MFLNILTEGLREMSTFGSNVLLQEKRYLKINLSEKRQFTQRFLVSTPRFLDFYSPSRQWRACSYNILVLRIIRELNRARNYKYFIFGNSVCFCNKGQVSRRNNQNFLMFLIDYIRLKGEIFVNEVSTFNCVIILWFKFKACQGINQTLDLTSTQGYRFQT